MVPLTEQKLTPDEKLRVQMADLLVGAVSSVLAAREKLEPGEEIEEDRHIPAHLLKSLGKLKGVDSLHLSKAEGNWKKLVAYAADLVNWVESIRSGTLIPLQRIESLVGKGPPPGSSAEEMLVRVEDKLEELNRRLDAIQPRLDKCAQIEQDISQVYASRTLRCKPSKIAGGDATAEETLMAFHAKYDDQTNKIQSLRRQACFDLDDDRRRRSLIACIRFSEVDVGNAIERLIKTETDIVTDQRSDAGPVEPESGMVRRGRPNRPKPCVGGGFGTHLLLQYLDQIEDTCAAQRRILLSDVVDILEDLIRQQ